MRKILSLLTVLTFLCMSALAQTRTVNGVVLDQKVEPIAFATITETGNKNDVKAHGKG